MSTSKNALAYFAEEGITSVKSFKVQTLKEFFICSV